MGGECGLIVQIRATSEPILDPVGRRAYTHNIRPKTGGRPIPFITNARSEAEGVSVRPAYRQASKRNPEGVSPRQPKAGGLLPIKGLGRRAKPRRGCWGTESPTLTRSASPDHDLRWLQACLISLISLISLQPASP